MNEIVKRLRAAANLMPDQNEQLLVEAADEIEKLRTIAKDVQQLREEVRTIRAHIEKTPESRTFRLLKDKIMSGMAKDLDVDHG